MIVPIISSAKISEDHMALVGVNVSSGTNTAEVMEVNNTSNVNVDTSLKVNLLGVPVVSSTQVSSDADLEIFSENAVAKNDNVSKVMISSEDQDYQVVVVFKHRGKLLGFIPVAIRSTTEVMAEENEDAVEVDSHLSWWGFLVAGENYDEAELESRIKSNAMIRANVKADASASAKARAAEAVIAEVQTHASTQIALNNS